MVGIVGKPFEEHGAIGTVDRPVGSTSIGEYGGRQGWRDMRTEPEWYSEIRKGGTMRRMATAIGDRFKSAMGEPTSADIENAYQIRGQAIVSDRSDQRAALAVANHLVDMPHRTITRVLPELAQTQMPAQRDLRWVVVATAAIDAIHNHVDRGSNQALSPELGRSARLAGVEDLAFRTGDFRNDPAALERPLANTLIERTGEKARQVRNYLSVGGDIDRAVETSAERRGIGTEVARNRDALTREMAEARAGLTPPGKVVAQAERFALDSGLAPDHMDGKPVRMPRHENAMLGPARGEALVAAELARGKPEVVAAKPAPVASLTAVGRQAAIAQAATLSR